MSNKNSWTPPAVALEHVGLKSVAVRAEEVVGRPTGNDGIQLLDQNLPILSGEVVWNLLPKALSVKVHCGQSGLV